MEFSLNLWSATCEAWLFNKLSVYLIGYFQITENFSLFQGQS